MEGKEQLFLAGAVGICGITSLIFANLMVYGPMYPPLFVFGFYKKEILIEGYCKEGYEEVRVKFEKLFQDGMEQNAQVAAYVDGELVVDLCGRFSLSKRSSESPQYSQDSIQNVFSSSKALTSIVVAMLVDKKRISYQTRIAEVWPEFGQHGKDTTTLEDLMKHESGLEKFDFTLEAADLQRDKLKTKKIVGDKIAGAKSSQPANRTENQRGYHALTRGFIINEICMRVDEKRRTVGEIMRDDIVGPLGVAGEFTLGVETAARGEKVFPLVSISPLWIVANMFNVFAPKAPLLELIAYMFFRNVKLAYSIAGLVFWLVI